MSAPPSSTSALPSGTPGPTAASPPWWAHLIIGGIAIGGSIALYALGNTTIGDAGFIAGLAFLGVGSGVAASS